MRISEISSPDLRRPTQSDHHHDNHRHDQILSRIDSLTKQTENLSPDNHSSFPDSLPSDLRQTLTQLTQLAPFPNSLKLTIWKLSYRLWNACVDLSNLAGIRLQSSTTAITEYQAKLRHIAADMLSIALDVTGVPSPAIKSASFYHKTGIIFHDLKNFNLASTCSEKATEIISKLDLTKISDSAEKKLVFDINLARARTAWEISDNNLAITLLNRSKSLLFNSPQHYQELAKQYLAFGRAILSNSNSNFNEALKLMSEGLDLCEKGSSAARTREQAADLAELKSKALRFISAVHLQRGEFESVIKCVHLLRGDGGGGAQEHPSLAVLAMKAWVGMGRYDEAERELKGMVVNKGIPEGVWVSAVEAYFEAAGVAAGAETAKGVFLGLLGRCHVSAKAAVRVVSKVGSGEGRVRAKVVAELVGDERVVALFSGEAVAKERAAMHAILWNCASENFRAKDYEMSAEIFEKSLLYIPHNIENRILRAKGYRVLCLCYLALSQLDRAQEYINEAEKLEPNIVCAFLKFKIYLQKNDHTAAINQIQAMRHCLDFTPDFLSLSAHEAVACRALHVAVASLSDLLNFYKSGKCLPITEVVVLRTLITILTQDPGHEEEILKFMKLAHARATELGAECFFGKGEVGRREQKWFAVTSWNSGTKCGKEKKYEFCAEFFRLVLEFNGGLIDGQAEDNSILVCESLILTVCAMIAAENQKKTVLVDSEVKQAVQLLDRAGKILTSISAEPQLGENKIDPDLFFKYTLIAYDIYGRLDNPGPQQLVLVKSFASSKACNAKYLLQIGLGASQGPRSNPEVATFSLNECLSALLSSPSPDYQDVALIVRRLIAVASIHRGDSDDDAVLNMYKQAYRIMVGLKENEYPVEEGKWLAMTAWNRAALPVRLGQVDAAKKWMNAGLELARKVSGMETYKACMEDFVAAFDKKFNFQSNG